MRGVCAERALAGHQLVEALRGGVERSGDGIDFGHARARCSHGEVSVPEAARCSGEPLQRPGEPAAEHERGDDRGGHDRGAEGGERQPRPVRPRGDRRVVALPSHDTADAFVREQRDGGREAAASRPVGGAAGAQRLAHERVRPPGPGSGAQPPVDAVHGERNAGAWHLDRVPGAAEVDVARRGDGVALEPQQLLAAIAALQRDGQRQREEGDGNGRDARDRHDEAPSHGASKR